MKILFHAFVYQTGWTYQENLLVEAALRAGHDVICVASQLGWSVSGDIKVCNNNDPAYVHRLKSAFSKIIPISYRIRKLKGFYDILIKEKPDIIFVNVIQTYNLYDIKRYKRLHPDVRVFYNTHTDYYTSGRNPFVRIILHDIIYRHLIKKNLDIAEKVFYVGESCGHFLWKEYKIPKEKTELMPIGAVLKPWDDIQFSRDSVLNELELKNNCVIFVQAGKMDAHKCLIETLKSFTNCKDEDFVLLLLGSIHESIRDTAYDYINSDSRIRFLGWKTGTELFKYIEASDVYLQPGKGSAIFENAICSGCIVAARYLDDYPPYVNGNGWLINNPNELQYVFESISNNKNLIAEMKFKSYQIAQQLLDQDVLLKKFIK